MNQNLTALIHNPRDPLDNFLEIATNVLTGGICQLQLFILEVLWVEGIHTTHSLDNMRDTCVLQIVETLSCLDVSNVKLRNNH